MHTNIVAEVLNYIKISANKRLPHSYHLGGKGYPHYTVNPACVCCILTLTQIIYSISLIPLCTKPGLCQHI